MRLKLVGDFMISMGLSFALFSVIVADAKVVHERSHATELQRPQLVATVIFGDKTTHFQIQQSGKTSIISMDNNEGLHRQRRLNSKDYNFIVAEFAKLPTANRLPEECRRTNMFVSLQRARGPASTKQGCLDVKSIPAQAYTRFANILTLAL